MCENQMWNNVIAVEQEFTSWEALGPGGRSITDVWLNSSSMNKSTMACAAFIAPPEPPSRPLALCPSIALANIQKALLALICGCRCQLCATRLSAAQQHRAVREHIERQVQQDENVWYVQQHRQEVALAQVDLQAHAQASCSLRREAQRTWAAVAPAAARRSIVPGGSHAPCKCRCRARARSRCQGPA